MQVHFKRHIRDTNTFFLRLLLGHEFIGHEATRKNSFRKFCFRFSFIITILKTAALGKDTSYLFNELFKNLFLINLFLWGCFSKAA